MKHVFSSTFVTALVGMSVITHANAQDTINITPDTIKEMYKYESKYPGATVTCYQAGQEIIHEPGLQKLSINEDGVSALRLDGSHFSLKTFGGDGALCKMINRKEQE